MTYNPITENLSFDYQQNLLLSDTTLTSWKRQLYDVSAASGSITITLPSNASDLNLLEVGSLFFRRLDTVEANTVTIAAVIGGTNRFIKIPINTEVVHWFCCAYDGGVGSAAFYFKLNSSDVDNQARVSKDPAVTVSTSNLNVAVNTYIGLVLNGATLAIGDSIVLAAQTNPIENGVYVVNTNGTISRRADCALGIDGNGYIVPITGGNSKFFIYVIRNISGSGFPALFGRSQLTISLYSNTLYTAGTGLTLSSNTFSITPQAGTSRAVITDSSGNLTTSTVTSSTLAFLDATSSVQTQLNVLSGRILSTTLTSAITNAVTTLPVTSTNGFSSVGIVYIGTEAILYTGKTSTTFTGCTRGYNGTTAAAQVINAYVNFLTEEVPYYKMGADFTTSTIPTRIFRDIMWMSGSAAGVRTWTPTQIPWVYTDITAAELACIYWIQKIMTFFKSLENDNNWDQIIGSLPSSIVSRITGNIQNPDSGTDMDNQIQFSSTPTYTSEWFELIVGRNPAGTELYTMSFTLALVSTAVALPVLDLMYPFRLIWQTTRGAAMAGFNGQSVVASSTSLPKCTQYTTSGVTIPAAGFPLWAMPVSLETIF